MTEEAGPTVDAGRLGGVLDDVAVAVYVKDPEGRFVCINRAGAEPNGLTPEAMIGRLQSEVVDPEAAAAWQAQDFEVLRNRVPWDGEEPLGESTYMTHKVPLFDAEGVAVAVIGISTNITNRKRREEQLRRSAAQLTDAQQIAGIGSWHWDAESGETTMSPELCRIYGIEPLEGPLGDNETAIRFVHPDDHELITEAARSALAGKDPLDLDVRITRPSDGALRLQDLTDLRRTRADLAEATELFRRCFEDAPVGMALVDQEGRFQQVNDALCSFLGRPAEELVGTTVMEVTDERDVASTTVALAEMASREAETWTVEKRYVRPDGTRVWGALRASVIRGADGGPLHGLAVIQDVTERLRAELRRTALHEAATVMAESGPLDKALPALVASLADGLGLSGGEVRLTPKGGAAPEPTPGRLGFWLLSGPEVVGRFEFEREGGETAGEELVLLTQTLGAQIGEFIVRKRAQEQLMHLALHDPLTGLPNRVLFFDRLDQALRRTQRVPAPLGVLFLDFDGFKAVNDRFGHAEGDEVLRRAAERVSSALRVNDTVARFGGDELVILSGHIAGAEAAQVIAERVLDALRAPIVLHDQPVELSASIGICVAMEPGATRDGMLRAADHAMYRAKASGPGRFILEDQ